MPFDVVVLGAGPAGLATAIAVRQRTALSVLVVDAGPPERDRAGETVPPGFLDPLSELGLAERFPIDGHLPCPGTASVWGRARVTYDDFVRVAGGPAWRLDRGRFDAMLAEAARESGVELRWRTRLVGLDAPSDTGPRLLHLSSSHHGAATVSTAFVVDATGPGAHYARAAGARRQVDDRLVAFLRFGAAAEDRGGLQTTVEAVPGGWWYGARTPAQRAVVMFVTDRPGASRLRAGGPAAFDAALQATTLVRTVASPATGGLRRRLLAVYSSALGHRAGDRWIAVGDAAASYDPIAGQGVHKALLDGIAAADHVHAHFGGPDAGRLPPCDETVREYRRRRAAVYEAETRFDAEPFWEARRASAARALQL